MLHNPLLKRLIGILALSLFGTACGGKSPTEPGTTQAGLGGSTAVISGSVRSGSAQLASTANGAPAGMTVSVVGTFTARA